MLLVLLVLLLLLLLLLSLFRFMSLLFLYCFPLLHAVLSESMNTEECCALGAMKAIHYIEQQKLIINSTTIPFMNKEFTVYGYGDLDCSRANDNTIIFDTKLHLEDDPSMDHDCMESLCCQNDV